MPSIVGVGIATLDIINEVEEYPVEDSEVRAVAQSVVRGGNVTNMLVVLSQLGHRCAWAGMIGDDAASGLIRDDLLSHGVDLSAVCCHVGGRTPTSYITLSRRSGTRSIVHYRQLPEFDYAAFANHLRHSLAGGENGPSSVSWLHFEGRAVEETARIMTHVRSLHPHLRVSVEVEKLRPGIDALFGLANVLIFSRTYAEALLRVSEPGVEPVPASAVTFLRHMRRLCPGQELVVAWGAGGAYALACDDDGSAPAVVVDAGGGGATCGGNGGACVAGVVHAPALPLAAVVDSLGAGDCFNAGYVDARARGRPVVEALAWGCRVAGEKCGQRGFAGLSAKLRAPQ
jgi:ketohexokinase